MKNKTFFSYETLKITFPFGKAILGAILLFPILLLLMEGFFHVIPIPEFILVPTIDRKINYPEIDIKFSRLVAVEKEMEINCFLLGNSMVDFGLNPSIFNSQPKLMGLRNPGCFNMALEAMMPETSFDIAKLLSVRKTPSLFIIGISAIDFAGKQYETRKFGISPWFQYLAGNFSMEGWMIDHSLVYKYWLSFKKYSNPIYLSELDNQRLLIDRFGHQLRQQGNGVYQVQPIVKLPDFQISQKDINGLIQIINLNSSATKIIVVEMPVNPDFIAYYVRGGETGYKNLFLEPVEILLKNKGVPFIQTQPIIADIVPPDGWIDDLHLNEKGAQLFSLWLVQIMNNILFF